MVASSRSHFRVTKQKRDKDVDVMYSDRGASFLLTQTRYERSRTVMVALIEYDTLLVSLFGDDSYSFSHPFCLQEIRAAMAGI